MSYLDWQSRFSIGIEEIDTQHKKIIEMINHLDQSRFDGSFGSEVNVVLVQLVKYSMEHFKYEEELMVKLKYPEFEKHRELHSELTDQIAVLLRRLKQGYNINAYEIISILKTWIIDHISKEDRKFGKHVQLLSEKEKIRS